MSDWDWKNPAVYAKIRKVYGDDLQIIQTIQELAELQQSLTRYLLADAKNHNYLDVLKSCVEETADAQLMIYQMMDLFGREFVEDAMQQKLERLRNRMIEHGKDVTLEAESPAHEKPGVCPFCESPVFQITSIQGAIATCQCDHCFNTFVLPGQWSFVDGSTGVKVRRQEGEEQ